MPKLRKPISAFLYSRLLNWADAICKGLNPPRSFNSVSTVRNRPSGDPNCELFPQGAIIPVPPSTPPYRTVGAYGNNRAVFPGRNANRKPPNQWVRRLLFPSFRWQLCSMAMPKQHQAVLSSTKNTSSEASSRYSHSFTLVYCCVIPVDSSWLVDFDRHTVESRRVTSRRRLGQILGQNRELFRNREPAVSFLSRGQKRAGFEAQKRPKWMPKEAIILIDARLTK